MYFTPSDHFGMQKFVDCVPKNEVHARAMGPSAPAARLQPASEAPTAPLASAAAPVMAKAEAVTVEKAEPATVAPDVAAPAVASPAVASPAVASPAVAASADERGGDAAALASPTDAGDNEQPKAVDTLREGGDAEQPRQNSGEPAANGRAEPQASTGVVRCPDTMCLPALIRWTIVSACCTLCSTPCICPYAPMLTLSACMHVL